jgi:hypothetical protein
MSEVTTTFAPRHRQIMAPSCPFPIILAKRTGSRHKQYNHPIKQTNNSSSSSSTALLLGVAVLMSCLHTRFFFSFFSFFFFFFLSFFGFLLSPTRENKELHSQPAVPLTLSPLVATIPELEKLSVAGCLDDFFAANDIVLVVKTQVGGFGEKKEYGRVRIPVLKYYNVNGDGSVFAEPIMAQGVRKGTR